LFSKWLHDIRELLLNVPFFVREFRFLSRVRPDVLIIRQTKSKMSGVLAAKWMKIPLVLEVNAPGTLEARTYDQQYWQLPVLPMVIERFTIRSADAVVTVSGVLARYLASSHGVSPHRIHVNPNGADPDLFDPGKVVPVTIAGVPADAIVVGFCASYQECHGAEMIIDLASALSDITNLHFLLVGDGPERPRIAKLVHDRGLERRITMVGRVPHEAVPEYLARMDVGLLPSTAFYCSPIKILEYLSMGLPVVAPRLESIEEIIQDGVQGLLFAPDDLTDLAGRVRQLAVDGDLRRRISRAARERLLDSRTWADNARRMEGVCRAAITAARSPQRS
jgi:glycosyltransferase involved in cell wall biosynthesis